MGVLREVFRQTLEADTALTTLLTGGIMDASELPADGGGSKSAPRESGKTRIQPYAVVRWRAVRPFSVEVLEAEKETVEVYIYQQKGYDTIEAAIHRMKALLHRQFLTADNRAIAHTFMTFISGELTAEELHYAPTRFIRFEVTQIRK